MNCTRKKNQSQQTLEVIYCVDVVNNGVNEDRGRTEGILPLPSVGCSVPWLL